MEEARATEAAEVLCALEVAEVRDDVDRIEAKEDLLLEREDCREIRDDEEREEESIERDSEEALMLRESDTEEALHEDGGRDQDH